MSLSLESSLKSGSTFGGMLLIAGSCIGAGMLALPVITGVGGFFPSLLIFFVAWAFMATTGLLLLEANLSLGSHLSLISLAEKTLGKVGKALCWVLFIFLFYSLSIAYIGASGSILQAIVADVFNVAIPLWGGSVLFTVVFGVVLFLGTKTVDYLNRLLMIGLGVGYLLLITFGLPEIQGAHLYSKNFPAAISALPVVIISFGFHNMIPSLAEYMRGDLVRLRVAVIGGSLIPLLLYLLWEAVMLGIIPVGGREGLMAALDKGQAVTEALRAATGRSIVGIAGEAFALFAIITSFLAQSLSLVDFLGDGLKIPKVLWGRVFLIVLTLVPPFAFAFAYPGVFIQALNVAGGFAAVVLFGAIPALMVWVVRYRQGKVMVPLMPTGRFLLVVVIAFSVFIFLLEGAQELGFSLIPKNVEVVP